jgi:RNA polymerase sigma factor (sigma-70 family)
MASNLRGPSLRSIRALWSEGTLSALTDAQLVERFTSQADDTAELAFTALVKRHGAMVLRVCRSILRDAHDAEDAFQATFLILALKAHSIHGRESLSSWLHSVAFNVAATAHSRAARQRDLEQETARRQSQTATATDPTPNDIAPIIHQELQRLPERYRTVLVLCHPERLPERYRTVLVLCHLEGLTHHQAAQSLGWPLGTVQSRLARGRERLRARLERRGMAPSIAVGALALSSETARALVPPVLANATLRLALTIGASRGLAIGMVPVAVSSLAEGVVRMMFVTKAIATSAAAILAMGLVATCAVVYAYQEARPEPSAAKAKVVAKSAEPAIADSHDGLLTVKGTVRMRDGSPLAGASVRTTNPMAGENSILAHTDQNGQFLFSGVFGEGCRLHISSADGSHQAVLPIPSVVSRVLSESALEVTLLPAISSVVTVLSKGLPVAGAHVVAVGTAFEFQVDGITGLDGKVRLRIPAKARLRNLFAWHPTLGVGGTTGSQDRVPDATTELSLLPPSPHKVRILDTDGHPMVGLELGVSVKTEDLNWIATSAIEAAHVRTDADGMAIVPWAPRDKLQYVEVFSAGSEVKIDDTDLKQIAAGLTTVRAQRERPVQGRLIMPKAVSAEGILVTGIGFGPGNNGHIPYARARRNGEFTLRVPSTHAYVLGITDLQWATNPWSGTIFSNDAQKPTDITMIAYPATPLTVRVTRGPQHDPIANAQIELSDQGQVAWTDNTGKKHTGTAGATTWLTTDSSGVARAGIGKGKHRLNLTAGIWYDNRTLDVTSQKPIEIEFHRPWKGEQRVTGKLLLEGAPHTPSPTLVAYAWAPTSDGSVPHTFEPLVHADGTFEVTFDAESISILFVDRDQEKSGFIERIRGDAQVEVHLDETGTYSGTLVNDGGQPIADRTLQIYAKTLYPTVVATQQTDKSGRFRLIGIPSKVPLQFSIGRVPDDPYYLLDTQPTLEAGELRAGQQLKLRRASP